MASVYLCAGALVIAAWVLAHAAHAFDDTTTSREAVIGTFNLQSPTEDAVRPAGVQAPSPGNDAIAPDTDARASIEHTFGAALAAIDRGDLAEAQGLFEQAIALDPRHPLAADAQRYLGDLYTITDIPDAGRASPRRDAVAAGHALDAALRSEPAGAGNALDAALRSEPAGAGNATRRSSAVARLEVQFIREAGDRVFFGDGDAGLGSRAVAVLAAQARWLNRWPDLDATIEAHADDSGLTVEQQMELSRVRAAAVRDRLVAAGVAPERLSVMGWGRADQVAPCESSSCAAQNRRAVTVLGLTGEPRRVSGTAAPALRRSAGDGAVGVR